MTIYASGNRSFSQEWSHTSTGERTYHERRPLGRRLVLLAVAVNSQVLLEVAHGVHSFALEGAEDKLAGVRIDQVRHEQCLAAQDFHGSVQPLLNDESGWPLHPIPETILNPLKLVTNLVTKPDELELCLRPGVPDDAQLLFLLRVAGFLAAELGLHRLVLKQHIPAASKKMISANGRVFESQQSEISNCKIYSLKEVPGPDFGSCPMCATVFQVSTGGCPR